MWVAQLIVYESSFPTFSDKVKNGVNFKMRIVTCTYALRKMRISISTLIINDDLCPATRTVTKFCILTSAASVVMPFDLATKLRRLLPEKYTVDQENSLNLPIDPFL